MADPILTKTLGDPDASDANLIQQRANGKRSFTAAKKRLERILLEDKPSRREIREALYILDTKVVAIDCTVDRLLILDNDDEVKWNEHKQWYLAFQSEYQDLVQNADHYLISRRGDTASTTSQMSHRSRSFQEMAAAKENEIQQLQTEKLNLLKKASDALDEELDLPYTVTHADVLSESGHDVQKSPRSSYMDEVRATMHSSGISSHSEMIHETAPEAISVQMSSLQEAQCVQNNQAVQALNVSNQETCSPFAQITTQQSYTQFASTSSRDVRTHQEVHSPYGQKNQIVHSNQNGQNTKSGTYWNPATQQVHPEAQNQPAHRPHVQTTNYQQAYPDMGVQYGQFPHGKEEIPKLDLEKIPLKHFSGLPNEDFFEFWDIFEVCVHQRPWPATTKMIRLRSCLKLKALEMVKLLPNSIEGYRIATDRLHEAFGGEHRFWDQTLDRLEALKEVKQDNLNELSTFLYILDSLLVSSSQNVDGNGRGVLYRNCHRKMNWKLRSEFDKWGMARGGNHENIHMIREFLQQEVSHLRRIQFETHQPTQLKDSGEPTKPKRKMYSNAGDASSTDDTKTKKESAEHSSGQKPKCVYCEKDHPLWKCEGFRQLSVDDRWKLVTEKKVCFRCLGRYHPLRLCRFKEQVCGIDDCDRSHNRMLHGRTEETQASATNEPASATNSEPTIAVTSSLGQISETGIALRTLPVVVNSTNNSVTVSCMLDDGSSDCLISTNVANKLKLKGAPVQLEIATIGGKEFKIPSEKVSFTVRGINEDEKFVIDAFVIDSVSGSNVVNWNKAKSKWPHLENIQFPNMPPDEKVELLIGVTATELHHSLEDRPGPVPGDPVARKTPLGWTCIGMSERAFKPGSTMRMKMNHGGIAELDLKLAKLWELEKPDTVAEYTPEEKLALETVNGKLQMKDDRYTIGMPWKPGEPSFPFHNRDMALSRLRSTERTLARNGATEVYQKKLDKQLEVGYISKVTNLDKPCWYLPHFPVIREARTTTKVRIVFDGSATLNNKSLNDSVFAGPKFQKEIFDVLLFFRKHKIALTGDVSEMFSQIVLSPEDRPFHRFIWKGETYQHDRVPFGNRASPFLAERVLQEVAEIQRNDCPQASQSIVRAMIVDDLTDSRDTVEETIQLRQEMDRALTSGGFKMRKWRSNDPNVLEGVPAEDCGQSTTTLSEEGSEDSQVETKILGIQWDPISDKLKFEMNLPADVKPTKRDVLKCLASSFDPHQVLAPFSMRGKCLLQKLWLANVDWDSELPEDLAREWLQWIEESKRLEIQIPRWTGFTKEDSETSVHVFVDASSLCYAAAVYLRTVHSPSGTVSVRLIAAKARVAPLKAITIPRLELCGGVEGVRIGMRVEKNYKDESNFKGTWYWSDSENVLFWVGGQSRKYKTFVANRVGEIHDNTSPSQWRYVPTRQNVADLATRGLDIDQMNQPDSEWFCGPKFLYLPEEEWPEQKSAFALSEQAGVENKKTVESHAVVCNKVESPIDPNKFGTWISLVRATRIVFLWRNPAMNLEDAEHYWISIAQRECFSREFDCLSKNRPLQKKSQLKTLNPTLDKNGKYPMLRLDGRLRKAKYLPLDTRQPILLPRDHPVTNLIIQDYHDKLYHRGVNQVLTEISQKFWILRGREAVKAYQFRCPWCKLLKAHPYNQKMAVLPDVRLQRFKPFSVTGIDFAGPFMTKQGRGKSRAKRYLALFCCLSTRAVHLEMVNSMDADGFLMAFERMIAHCGKPDRVVTDNGTNFVAAERILNDLVKQLDHQKIERRYEEIKWIFNPPSASHFGGCFESLIKSAKRAIQCIMADASVNDEELATTFSIAKRLLNGRPLTYPSSDASDEPPLTPNHFIVGQAGGALSPEVDQGIIAYPRKRWTFLLELTDHFWRRWMKEYLPTLHKRNKWHKEQPNLHPGDIVLYVDANTKRGDWPLGRVVNVHPGDDGLVRVVSVKFGKNEPLMRPTHKLALIERAH